MARIGKVEHPRILQAVDVEGRRVAEIAAEYGCTPANIYALLSKLRRADKDAESSNEAANVEPAVQPETAPSDATSPTPVDNGGADLFAAPALPELPARVPSAAVEADGQVDRRPSEPKPPTLFEASAATGNAPREGQASQSGRPAVVATTVTELPRRKTASDRGGLGATLAKPGFGLLMRDPEGEESLTPFRSLEDLLSAIKPILRTAARCPDPVWFSIQPVDLTALTDAA